MQRLNRHNVRTVDRRECLSFLVARLVVGSKNQLHVQTTINARKERLYIRRYILVLTAAGTISGTHEHMVEHTICEDEFVCPLGDE